ncbi:MAG: TetR/AcrR family transcriptional regulator [Deltaproteobacteria bacterium]|nr:MAG: TetR/AcrR family transcriptional regulator [Deltaproteobacteria bacterium]
MGEEDLPDRIVREATRLFAHKGYGSTSVRELAEAVGVTKPTLYYHFGNKESLFLKVVHYHIDRIEEIVRDAVAPGGTVREQLARFAREYIREAANNQDALRLLLTVQQPTEREQPSVDIMSLHLRKIAVLQDVFAAGVSAGEIRADLDPHGGILAFIGMVNLACVAALHGDCTRPEDHAATIIDIFYRGVGA